MLPVISTRHLDQAAGALLIQQMAAIKHKPFLLALAGGRTVPKLLRTARINWKRVHVFLTDERLVPAGDPHNNWRALQTHLLAHIDIPKTNLHPYSQKAGPAGYARALKKLGGRFDLVVVSAGEDGHIASLFPQKSALNPASYFLEMKDAPKPPTARMSMSRKLFLKSRAALVVFSGKKKGIALRAFLDPKTRWRDCPAKLALRVPCWAALTDQPIPKKGQPYRIVYKSGYIKLDTQY